MQRLGAVAIKQLPIICKTAYGQAMASDSTAASQTLTPHLLTKLKGLIFCCNVQHLAISIHLLQWRPLQRSDLCKPPGGLAQIGCYMLPFVGVQEACFICQGSEGSSAAMRMAGGAQVRMDDTQMSSFVKASWAVWER